jgi:3-methylfumaryl-CoA hydratase
MTAPRPDSPVQRAVFTEHLDLSRAAALAGLLGAPVPELELPLLWHWVYLLPGVAQDGIGPDGHPLAGIPAPPGPGMRRMFAGGTARSLRPLRLGRVATRITELADTTVREGRSGTLTFVTVRTVIEQDGLAAVQEEQTIVYRTAAPAAASAGPVPSAAPRPSASYVRGLVPDPVLLFRFSALTYNAHRIHYDRDYATGAEGYPGLVVHGPLQALLMLEAARATHGRAPTSFEFRLSAPSFDGQQLWITAERAGGRDDIDEVRTAVHSPGGEGATGTAAFAPPTAP